MRTLLALVLLVGCGHRGHQSLEDDDEDPRTASARCCMGAKDWDAQNSGWKSPRHNDWLLGPGGKGQVAFRPAKGLTYRFEACGSEEIEDLDLLLYDSEGEIVIRDEDDGREAMITWTAKERGKYTLMAYVRKTTGDAEGAVWFTRRQYDPD